jgi:thiaminase
MTIGFIICSVYFFFSLTASLTVFFEFDKLIVFQFINIISMATLGHTTTTARATSAPGGYSQKLLQVHPELLKAAECPRIFEEMSKGTLPVEQFRELMIQRYAVGFSLKKFLGLAIAKFPYHFKWLGGECATTILAENIADPQPTEFFNKMKKDLKIQDTELKPNPAAKGFSDFLLNIGYAQGYKEALVVLVVMGSVFRKAFEAAIKGQSQAQAQQLNPLFKEFFSQPREKMEKFHSWAEKSLNEIMASETKVTPKHSSVVQYTLQWHVALMDSIVNKEKWKWPAEAQVEEHMT